MQEYEVRRIFLPQETAKIREMQLQAPEFLKHYPKHAEWLDMAINEVLEGTRVAFGVFKYGVAPDRKLAVEILGSIILKENEYTGVTELKNLYVVTDQRRRGYGRAINSKLVEFCAKAGYSAIQTEVPCDEIGTISFLLKMGYHVVDVEPSPYREDESIYNMRCGVPPYYNGDVFDLRSQAIWVLKDYYGFIPADAPFNETAYHFSIPRSQKRPLFSAMLDELAAAAFIVDGPDPLSKRKLEDLIKNKNAYLSIVFAEKFTDEARELASVLGIKLFDSSSLTEKFGGYFAYGAPPCLRDKIDGMIVEIKPELFERISSVPSPFSYFKGGPNGKYLRPGNLAIFHLDPTPDKTRNGICGFARIDRIEVGDAGDVWEAMKESTPVFSEEEYRRYSRSKQCIIGLQLSGFEEISDIPINDLPILLGAGVATSERIGHLYVDETLITKIQQRRKVKKVISGEHYDVALTFAGEDRPHAKTLAEKMKAAGISVFYDEFEQADLWGKDLYQHLQSVYRDRAKYCLILISKNYPAKAWTRHELKQAQARAFKESDEYILPLRLDDTGIPGLNDTVGYIDLRNESVDTVVALLLKKLNK